MDNKENKINLTTSNMQSLLALQKKYERDYLLFFQELSKMYQQGETKKQIDEALQNVDKIITLLKDIISYGSVSVKDSEKIYTLVDKLEEKKIYFLDQIPRIKALQEKVQKIEQKTGISLDDLNVTSDIAKESVAISRKGEVSQKSKLSRLTNLPTVRNLASEAGKFAGVTAAGPFYNIAKDIFGFGKDVYSAAKGYQQDRIAKRDQQREEDLMGSLRTSSSGENINRFDLEGLKSARNRPPVLSGFEGMSNRKPDLQQQVAPLKEFFDKDAYKTKWTKELLENSKAAKDQKMGFFDDLKSGFEGLHSGILPLIGKAGVFAGLAVATGFAVNRLYTLGGKIKEYFEVADNVKREIAKQQQKQEEFKNKLDVALGAKLQESVMSGDENLRADTIQQIKSVETERAQKEASETGLIADWKSGFSSLFGRKKSQIVPEQSPSVIQKSEKMPAGKPQQSPSVNVNLSEIPEMKEMNKNIDALTKQLKESNQPVPAIIPRNPFDAGDTLLNDYSKGKLSIGN